MDMSFSFGQYLMYWSSFIFFFPAGIIVCQTLLCANVELMPVTNISYKLRQFFLQTGMLYRGGGGEILHRIAF